MDEKKVKYIFWADEGIVSEVVLIENSWFHYKYCLGQIGDSQNSFMGEGKITHNTLCKRIDDGVAFVF